MTETTKLLIALAAMVVIGAGAVYAMHKIVTTKRTIVTFKVEPCVCEERTK